MHFGAFLCRSQPILIAASLFVIYLILAILYESLIHPITIISDPLPSARLEALACLPDGVLLHYLIVGRLRIRRASYCFIASSKERPHAVDFAQQVRT